jgi:hypothetical protein
MTEQDDFYQPPALVEVGDFAAVTNGITFPGRTPDWAWPVINLCPDGC